MKEQLEWKERLGWKAQIEMWEVQMKDLLETSRPPATTPAAKRNYETSRDQNSTEPPKLEDFVLGPSTRVLIFPGEYLARLEKIGEPHWYKPNVKSWPARWQLDFHFVIDPGKTLVRHTELSRSQRLETELSPNSVVGRLMLRAKVGRLTDLIGKNFVVTVETRKDGEGQFSYPVEVRVPTQDDRAAFGLRTAAIY